MRTSHREIRRKIQSEKEKVSDEALFASRAFAAYLADIAQAASKRYKRPFQVHTFWDTSPGAQVAWTDNKTITINTGNHISMGYPTRLLKADSLLGLLAHEVGHILFTDHRVINNYIQEITSGHFFPHKPGENLTLADEDALLELENEYAEKNIAALETIAEIAHDFWNITEDAYIEANMCQAFPGKFRTGILLNRLRLVESSLSIQAQIEHENGGLSIVRNLILQYCSSGDINNREGYTGEYLDVFNECIPILDDCKYDEDARSRCSAANYILLKLWKYIKPVIEQAKLQGSKMALEKAQEGNQETSEIPANTDCDPVKNPGFLPPCTEQMAEGLEEMQEVVDFEKGRIALALTDTIEDGDDGGVDFNNRFGGTGYEHCGDDIDRLLNSMAEDRVNTLMEQELTAELQEEASKIRYGNAHKGIRVIVNRMPDVTDYLVSEYLRVSPPLKLIAKRMCRQVLQVLKDQKHEGKLSGLLMGRRLEPRTLVHNNGCYFSKRRLPSDGCDLAVALLVDESGSMSSNDRITAARATSVVLHLFCQFLNIPVMIMGHTANGKTVDLYSYADFETYDKKDCYRLMDMSARSDNRDGAALRYVAERLLKRPENKRLLILISDGEPYAPGYYGTEAEADLRGIRREYTNRGLTMIAAAIGDDRENIERIYKEGFLDISDLKKLPEKLTALIARYIKQH